MAAVELCADKNAVDYSSDKTAVDLSTDETAVDFSTNQTAVDFSADKTAVDFSTDNNATDVSAGNSTVDVSVVEGSLDLSVDKTAVNFHSGTTTSDSKADWNSADAYTKRDGFTSENFKIEIRNLPRYYGLVQVKKLMNKQLQLNAHKVKPVPDRGGGLYVTFLDEESRQKALKTLNGYKWKKTCLSARVASAMADPFVAFHQKRSAATSHSTEHNKKPKIEVDVVAAEQQIRETVTPWWNLTYSEQLAKKQEMAVDLVARYRNSLRNMNYELYNWVMQDGGANQIQLEDIRPSPVQEKYRNKCEFTVGHHPTTAERVVGFRLASYKQGSVAVVSPRGLSHIPDRMLEAAYMFEEYVRQSEYAPFDPVTHDGNWRQLLARLTRDGQLLLAVQFHPQSLSEQQLQEESQQLRRYIVEGAGSSCCVTSLHWQTLGARQAGQSPGYELLHGEPHITETLCGLQVRISPDAFLQVNTPATEVLYDAVAECADIDATTTVLDVCCGAGTIGLSLAARAAAVLGVDVVPVAVENATLNAQLNGLQERCTFVAGRAEKVLPQLLRQVRTERAVAIVDPPRAGLGREVCKALRSCSGLQRVVYLACDIRQSMTNLLDLVRPTSKQYCSEPFLVRRVIPVDLFPLSAHTELVLLLERHTPVKHKDSGTPAMVAEAGGTTAACHATDSGKTPADSYCERTIPAEVQENSDSEKTYPTEVKADIAEVVIPNEPVADAVRPDSVEVAAPESSAGTRTALETEPTFTESSVAVDNGSDDLVLDHSKPESTHSSAAHVDVSDEPMVEQSELPGGPGAEQPAPEITKAESTGDTDGLL